MRISLIHGENSPGAYEKYRNLVEGSKKKGFEIISISDIHHVVSQSLFEDKIVFTLEKPGKIGLSDWKWLAKNAPKYNSNLLIYYEGSAPVTVTKNLPKNAKVERFDLPKIIFQFLESFWQGNSKNCLRLLNDVVRNEPIELVFFLLGRHIRDLAWVGLGKETMQLPSWRIQKFSHQAGKFEAGKLEDIISELAEIDVRVKTSDEDLRSLLDLLIIEELE